LLHKQGEKFREAKAIERRTIYFKREKKEFGEEMNRFKKKKDRGQKGDLDKGEAIN